MLAALIVVTASLLAFGLFFIIEKNRKNQVSEDKNDSGGKIEYRDRGPIDYDIYLMTIKERIFYIIIAALAIYVVGFIFYRSHSISLLLTPLAILYPRIRTKDIIKKRKRELNLQFKEALYALSSSLSAGKSIEMAFRDCLKDLIILYPAPDTYIIREFQYIVIRLDMNETIEDVLMDFANRAHLEDVSNFVDVFATSKRTGGNIIEIIKNTSKVIADKIHIKNDIETMLSEKKLEQKLLNIIPIGLIVILSMNAADYMEPVFNTTFGRAMMTISIILLGIAFIISKKIMDIEV